MNNGVGRELIESQLCVTLNNSFFVSGREDVLDNTPGLVDDIESSTDFTNVGNTSSGGTTGSSILEVVDGSGVEGFFFRNSNGKTVSVAEVVHESSESDQIEVVEQHLEISRSHLVRNSNDVLTGGGEETTEDTL